LNDEIEIAGMTAMVVGAVTVQVKVAAVRTATRRRQTRIRAGVVLRVGEIVSRAVGTFEKATDQIMVAVAVSRVLRSRCSL
jgi:hypothetical protein